MATYGGNNSTGKACILQDAHMRQSGPTYGYGACGYIWVRSVSADMTRALIKVSLSGMSGITSVTSAYVYAYWYSHYNAAATGRTYRVYMVRNGQADWTESGGCADVAGDCCWNNKKASTAWGTAGCANTSTDIDTSKTSTIVLPSSGAEATYVAFNVTDIVNYCLTQGYSNFTIRISDELEDNVNKDAMFYSRTAGANQPYFEATCPNPPTVSTVDPPTSITGAGATLEGSVTEDDGQTVDYVGFVYGKVSDASNPGDVDPNTTPGNYTHFWRSQSGNYGENPFDAASMATSATGDDPRSTLDALTTYYYRACAHSSYGWSYGAQVSFTTLATHRISNASSSGIKIGGVLIPDTAKIYVIDDLTDTVVLKNPVSGLFTNDVYSASGVCPHVHAVCVYETRATLVATNITYTAAKNAAGKPLYFPGMEGNKIRVKHQTGGSLSVSCTDNRSTTGYYDVTITYVADTTTATEVSAALAADSIAKYVLSASTGSGKIATQDFTALSGGEYYTSSAHVFVTPTEIA